jgi:hypothetical protein
LTSRASSRRRCPDRRIAFVFGSGEAAVAFGSTNAPRSANQARADDTSRVTAYGGAVALGVVHRATSAGGSREKGADLATFGDVVGQVELGYASGDSDPYDGVERRFVMHPNHRVGLLLFDEIVRFQTARAATAAADPLLANASRPPPGLDLLPSNGGVFGAEYVNPTMVVRPRQWLDLKAGAVFAQATADVVDPYRVATRGAYVNYRGGNARRHDLGVELDLGVEARTPLDKRVTLVMGARAACSLPATRWPTPAVIP